MLSIFKEFILPYDTHLQLWKTFFMQVLQCQIFHFTASIIFYGNCLFLRKFKNEIYNAVSWDDMLFLSNYPRQILYSSRNRKHLQITGRPISAFQTYLKWFFAELGFTKIHYFSAKLTIKNTKLYTIRYFISFWHVWLLLPFF